MNTEYYEELNTFGVADAETEAMLERLSVDAGLTAQALEAYVPSVPLEGDGTGQTGAVEPTLSEAMRYSLFSGGKKIRPALVIETCRMFGGTVAAALPFACGLEMIHTYSLIHDDLPCMDNDNLRRGKPTNHKVYGEAIAVLAGDALLTDAFRVVSGNTQVPPAVRAEAVMVLSGAAGSPGMVSGQVMDMKGEKEHLSLAGLENLHRHKTGALICAAVKLGCLAAGVPLDDDRAVSVTQYAEKLGIAFQVVDDVLDVTSQPSVLGKSTGKDLAEGKTTFLTYYTPEQAMKYAAGLTGEAVQAIGAYPENGVLRALAKYLLKRKN